jgi:hypothetical protein
LDDDGAYDDDEEERVVEEVLEDIDFCMFQFPCINLIEYLQQHKHIKEYGVMSPSFLRPLPHFNGGRDTQ